MDEKFVVNRSSNQGKYNITTRMFIIVLFALLIIK